MDDNTLGAILFGERVEVENPYKIANQLRKAKVLADVLRKVGARPNDTDTATVRRLAEQAAGSDRFTESSDTTWAMVAVLLED